MFFDIAKLTGEFPTCNYINRSVVKHPGLGMKPHLTPFHKHGIEIFRRRNKDRILLTF